ncbi:MAG: GntR family transcriptional regulator, partial [Anaerolineae bacterium]
MVASRASKSLRTTIDRSSPIPYYVQLKEALRAPIEQGLWQPGDQIPGESELCHLFDVSRTVV